MSREDDSSKNHEEEATRFVEEGTSDSEFIEVDFELNEDLQPDNSGGLVGVVGDYLLIDTIGSGGMGRVYRAEHRTMNRQVALKILSQEIAGRPTILQQFFAEIRAVAKLMHPNIVTAFDAGTASNGMHYLVMELVDGDMLSARVRGQGPLPPGLAISILEQAGQALAYAHKQDIVHRDIKPSNMMLTRDGVLKILDFGLARISSNAKLETTSPNKRVFMGTAEYMSPEQIQNPDDVDARSDLYSLGASLFYLLTGKPMFTGEKMQIARAQLHETPKPLFVVRSDIDLRLDSVFQRLVAKNPAERYSSADDLLDNLAKLNLSGHESSSGSSVQSSVFQRGSFRLANDSPTSVGYGMSTLAKKSQIIGIDFGLLTSDAAYYDVNTGPQIIPQSEGTPGQLRNMIWSTGKSVRIGGEAAALRQVEPEKIFHSLQRWIGQGTIAREFAGERVPAEVLIAAVLRQIVHNSANTTDGSQSAIVTVPSCYDQMHRRSIRDACRLANLELVQLLDRPLAGALSWLDVNSHLSSSGSASVVNEKLLFVQLAGTGLDVNVLHAHGNTVRQLGACGHWTLGSQRWQGLLVQYFSNTLKEKTGKSIRHDVSAATRLQRTVEIAMNQLTHTSRVEIRFDWEGASIQQVVTQDGLVKISRDLTLSMQQSIATACAIAKVDISEIDQVLLAGSMMRMRPVKKIVTAVIPHQVPVTVVEKSDFARGAAIQARYVSNLTGSKNKPLLYAQPCCSYDIALLAEAGGQKQRPRVLIEKGTSYPASQNRTVRPKAVAGQSSSEMPTIQLIESTSMGQGNWVKLGRMDLDNLAREPEADAMQLQLELDANGILETNALTSEGTQIPVPSAIENELSEAEIEKWRDWLETALLCAS